MCTDEVAASMSARIRGIERVALDEQLDRVRRALLEGERQRLCGDRPGEQPFGVCDDAVVRDPHAANSTYPSIVICVWRNAADRTTAGTLRPLANGMGHRHVACGHAGRWRRSSDVGASTGIDEGEPDEAAQVEAEPAEAAGEPTEVTT